MLLFNHNVLKTRDHDTSRICDVIAKSGVTDLSITEMFLICINF